MGASLALAGMAGCTRQPPEQIVPYVAAARRNRAGPAALLRDGDDARRPRDGPARREPRRTADEDRRQSAASRRASARPTCSGRRAARSLRPRSHADADAHRRNSPVVGVHRRDAHGADRAAGDQRRRTAHPHRNRLLAHARRADRGNARALPGALVASMGYGAAR